MKRFSVILLALLLSLAASAQVGRFKNIPVLYPGYSFKFDTATGTLSAVKFDSESGETVEEIISKKKSNDTKQVGRYEFRRTFTPGTYRIFDTSSGKYTTVKWEPKQEEPQKQDDTSESEIVVKSSTPLPVDEDLDAKSIFPGISKDRISNNNDVGINEESVVYSHQGNILESETVGIANAHLKGRTVIGSLPKPSYGIQAEGTVVVQIKVDQYGNVTEAIPGAEGTTVTDKELWKAARNAAMKAHFNMKSDATALQTGTITYVFKLK